LEKEKKTKNDNGYAQRYRQTVRGVRGVSPGIKEFKIKKKSFPTGADWYVEFANIFVIFGIPVSVRFARTPVCELQTAIRSLCNPVAAVSAASQHEEGRVLHWADRRLTLRVTGLDRLAYY